jgi:hypothetical protein
MRSASASLACPVLSKSSHAAMTACCGSDRAVVTGVVTNSLTLPAEDRKRNRTTAGLQRELRHTLYRTMLSCESLQAARADACPCNAARSALHEAVRAATGSAAHC